MDEMYFEILDEQLAKLYYKISGGNKIAFMGSIAIRFI